MSVDLWDTSKIQDNFKAITQNKIDVKAISTGIEQVRKTLPQVSEMLTNLPLDEVEIAFTKTEAEINKTLTKIDTALKNPIASPFAKIDSLMTSAAKSMQQIDASVDLGKLNDTISQNVDQLLDGVPEALSTISESFADVSKDFGGLVQLKSLTGDLGKIVSNLNLPKELLNVDELLKQAGTLEFELKINQLKAIPNIDIKAIEQIANLGPKLASLDIAGMTNKLIDLNPQKLLESKLGDIQSKVNVIANQMKNFDVASLNGALAPNLEALQSGLKGLIDANKDQFQDLTNNMQAKMEAIVSNFDNINIKDFHEMARAMESAKGDFGQFLGELEKQGHIIRGKTVSGIRTVPSAIQSIQTTPGSRPSASSTSSSSQSQNARVATTSSGGQPGRLAGTRVSFANSDPRQVPRQDIIDALDAMCNSLDIYVQITPQGGWTYRSSGTQNHPTGWAADFQVLADTGGLLYPKYENDLYGEIAQFLRDYAKGKGKTPGIGCYSNFMHYDEYPPRTQNHPNLKYITWGSGWPLRKYLDT